MTTTEYGTCPKCGNKECCVTRDETGELWHYDECGHAEDIDYFEEEDDDEND